MITEPDDDMEETLASAKDARTGLACLVELLRGCPADYPLTAGLLLGVLVPVQSSLESVVDGVHVMAGATGFAVAAPALPCHH
jgi:hypothetical protein